MKKILIMGLPGAGKTTLAKYLKEYFESYLMEVTWLNADEIRKSFNDWDFSYDGRIRQSIRMTQLASREYVDFVIADFVAPLAEMRDTFNPDYTIWVDTISEGRFVDTNRAFTSPVLYDFRITEQDAEKWSKIIGYYILTN